MKHMAINDSKVGVGVGIWMSELATLEDKWEGKLNEVAAQIDGMDVLQEGGGFGRVWSVWTSHKAHTSGTFQWFLDIFSYLQFVT